MPRHCERSEAISSAAEPYSFVILTPPTKVGRLANCGVRQLAAAFAEGRLLPGVNAFNAFLCNSLQGRKRGFLGQSASVACALQRGLRAQ